MLIGDFPGIDLVLPRAGSSGARGVGPGGAGTAVPTQQYKGILAKPLSHTRPMLHTAILPYYKLRGTCTYIEAYYSASAHIPIILVLVHMHE